MFNKKLFLISLLTICILTFGCEKEENPVDGGGNNSGPTQIGAGTMSCKINGQSWSSTTIPGSNVPGAYATTYIGGAIIITGNQFTGTGTQSTINLILVNVGSTGEYRLGTVGVGGSSGYAILIDGRTYTTSYNTPNINGKVVVTKYDPTNKIISGTFEFNAKESDSSTETKVVTEGKFDVKWDQF